MTSDRLVELRDLIATARFGLDQLRQEQLELLPAVRASKAPTTAIAAAFGISRAAFYKNGYDKIGAGTEGDPERQEELLEQLRELEAARADLALQIIPWRQERDRIIVCELTNEEKPSWAQLRQDAGVSAQWISRLKSQKAS
jgi:hypothetical protein